VKTRKAPSLFKENVKSTHTLLSERNAAWTWNKVVENGQAMIGHDHIPRTLMLRVSFPVWWS
jgi:hypothetical protein